MNKTDKKNVSIKPFTIATTTCNNEKNGKVYQLEAQTGLYGNKFNPDNDFKLNVYSDTSVIVFRIINKYKKDEKIDTFVSLPIYKTKLILQKIKYEKWTSFTKPNGDDNLKGFVYENSNTQKLFNMYYNHSNWVIYIKDPEQKIEISVSLSTDKLEEFLCKIDTYVSNFEIYQFRNLLKAQQEAVAFLEELKTQQNTN